MDHRLLQGPAGNGAGRSASSIRERWRKHLRQRHEASGGALPLEREARRELVAAAAGGKAAAAVTSTAGRRANGGGCGGGKPKAGGHRKVPKAVANALWRRDCGQSFHGRCAQWVVDVDVLMVWCWCVCARGSVCVCWGRIALHCNNCAKGWVQDGGLLCQAVEREERSAVG